MMGKNNTNHNENNKNIIIKQKPNNAGNKSCGAR